MEKLLEILRGIGNRIKEWWDRFTAKQRTLIVMVVATAVLAIAILVTALTRPQYVLLKECEDTTQASNIRDLLDGEELTYQISDDGLRIEILKSQQSDAILLLGANNIRTAGYGLENVTNGSFSTTESDKQKQYVLYLEKYLEDNLLEPLESIESATVTLHIPENTGTLLDSTEESTATVILKLTEEMPAETAAALARAVATGIGNPTTNNVVIMDTLGNMLYSGDDNYSVAGAANVQLSVKTEAEALVVSKVKQALRGTNEFDTIEVATNLVLDFSTTKDTTHLYYAPDGQTQGVYSHEDSYESENESGIGGVPGTDSNDNDTTYVLKDDANSKSSIKEYSRDYLPNERITSTDIPAGLVDYAKSSLSATAISYNIIREEDVRAQGLLDGITWDEYKLNNQTRTKLEVDEDLVNVVAQASGISAERIALVAYSENLFFDDEGSGLGAMDIIQIILIIVILGLLAFVVLRSMRSEKQGEEEEELSVENLLQSTQDMQLVDIPMEEETETARLINKFVEENPEAAANLLRNWLNEDWGI